MPDPDPQPPVWVSVLLDWQNIYKCARDAFGLTDEGSIAGTIDPLKLARHLTSSVSPDGRLQEVRIYRGRPDNVKDSIGYAAWRSQTAAWKSTMGESLIERYRDLKYRGDEVMEKGIDVWLAIDLVKLAMDKEVDRAIVVSSDTDLLPAIELADEISGGPFVEVAGWVGDHPSAAILSVDGVPRRQLGRTLYERFRDETDYNLSLRVRKKSGWDAQIQAEGRVRRQS
jgi:uncharacterized LabA/DUF88 family protein